MTIACCYLVWHYQEEFVSVVFAAPLQVVVGSYRIFYYPPFCQAEQAQLSQSLL